MAAYERPEELKLQDKIQFCQEHMQVLELELKECLESEIPSLEARIDELYFEISSLTAKQKKLQGSKS